MAKWKGFKVEWRDQECRLVHKRSTSPWWKPLRFSNGDLSRWDFFKVAYSFWNDVTFGPRSWNWAPIGFTYTTLRPTTGGVTITYTEPKLGYPRVEEEFKIVTARSTEITFDI